MKRLDHSGPKDEFGVWWNAKADGQRVQVVRYRPDDSVKNTGYERLHPKRITSYPKIGQFEMFSKTSIMTNA